MKVNKSPNVKQWARITSQKTETLKSRNENWTDGVATYKSHNIVDKNSRNVPSLKNYESNALNSKKINDIKSSSFIGKPKPPQTTKASKRTEIPNTFVYDNWLVSYNLFVDLHSRKL